MFLSDDTMRGVVALQIAIDHALGVTVGRSDGIEPERAPFVLDGYRPAEAAQNNGAGKVGKRVCGFEQRGEGGGGRLHGWHHTCSNGDGPCTEACGFLINAQYDVM